MANDLETRSFVQAWLKDLSDEVADRWYRVIPIWICLFVFLGSVAAYFLPDEFWTSGESATTVYTGVLTLNGILLALSWSAFSKIYDIIGAGNFSAFLRDNKVLDSYLFAVRYVHAAQMVALTASIAALLVAQYHDVPINWQRVICAVMLGLGAYAIKQAAMSVGIMQDLVRYKAVFDSSQTTKGVGLRREGMSACRRMS